MPTEPAKIGHLADGNWLHQPKKSPEILHKAAVKKKNFDETFKPVVLNWSKKDGTTDKLETSKKMGRDSTSS